MYRRATESSERLAKDSARKNLRHHWLNVIDLYRLIFETAPEAPEAPAAMYKVGRLYRGLSVRSGVAADLDMAIYYFRRLVRSYPSSEYADDALFEIGQILLKEKNDPAQAYLEFERVKDGYPASDKVVEASALVKKLSRHRPDRTPPSVPPPPQSETRLAQVNSIRYWSNPSYTRVVVDTDIPVRFNHHFIRDETQDSQPKLYIDLFNSALGPNFPKPIPIADGLLLQCRAGQFTQDTVRVVLDISRITDYRVFSLSDPFRIVADVSGNGKEQLQVVREAAPPQPPPVVTAGNRSLSLAQQLGLSVKRVVIDPGHGGNDPGAIGPEGLQEKDVTLDVSLRLQKLLAERYGLEVIMTREGDVSLPLEERTAIANTNRADLFISVHCNASPKKILRGSETFFLNLASSRGAAETAAMENMTSLARIGDFEKTMVDLFMTMKIDESSRFARISQEELFATLKKEYKDSVNLGVKQAPFVVLIGAQMPSILSEISFIDHPVEGKRLAAEEYRRKVAEALANGIGRYAGSVNVVSSK